MREGNEQSRAYYNPLFLIVISDFSVQKLQRRLDRMNRERIPFPDTMTVLQLPEKDFLIWMTDPEVDKLDDEVLEVLIEL